MEQPSSRPRRSTARKCAKWSAIAARHALSKEVRERTSGVALCVEEVTRLLLERGEEGGAPLIPPTLQQPLAARTGSTA